MHIDLLDFYEQDSFYKEVRDVLPLNERYTVFIKVRYHKDKYFMAGNQFPLKYFSYEDLEELHDIVYKRLQDYFVEYKLVDSDIEYIMLSFNMKDMRRYRSFY